MTTLPKRFTEMTVQEIKDLATPNHEYVEIKQFWPKPNVDWSDRNAAVERLRMYTMLGEEIDEKDPSVNETDVQATGRDGQGIRVHVWTSKTKASRGPSPLIVLFFGGGFISGSPTQMSILARMLCKNFNAVVTAPAYRLAPEHPFPVGIEDCWDSFKWIATNAAATFGADPSKGLIVGGISAGALSTTVVCHLARDEKFEPKITGAWTACGSARVPNDGSLEDKYTERMISRKQEEVQADPLLSSNMQQLFLDCVKPDMNSKLYSPMKPQIWPGEDNHKNLPRTYFQVCGLDGSRDEALTYEDLLKTAGVETKLHLYPGLPHCFWLSLRDMDATAKWKVDVVQGFKWLLGA